MAAKIKKTNPRLGALMATLRDASRENEAGVWREIAKRLETSSKNYAEVNLSKINRYAKENETIIVPGKVLGSGVLDQKVSVAALNFSETAAQKIQMNNGRCMSIEDLISENPKGTKVRVLR